MDIALGLATLLTVFAALAPLSRHTAWWIRGLDFPVAQTAVWTALLIGAHFFFPPESPRLFLIDIMVLFVCLLWQLWRIWPYTPLHPKEIVNAAPHPPEDARLRLLVSNVLGTNRDASRLLAAIKREKPDLFITLETDAWWQEKLDTLERDYPHSLKCPQDNLYGMHLYSRLPLEKTEIEFLVEDHVPSMHACLRLRNGRAVRLHALHPAPPSPTENEHSKERDAELVVVAKAVAEEEDPVIVTGDLNDVAWSPTTHLFRKISGLLDPRIGRAPYPTFPADFPLLRWPLDHIFHSGHFRLAGLKRLEHIGSDHFPILVDLVLTAAPGENGEAPEADGEDRARAREIMAGENVKPADVPDPT